MTTTGLRAARGFSAASPSELEPAVSRYRPAQIQSRQLGSQRPACTRPTRNRAGVAPHAANRSSLALAHEAEANAGHGGPSTSSQEPSGLAAGPGDQGTSSGGAVLSPNGDHPLGTGGSPSDSSARQLLSQQQQQQLLPTDEEQRADLQMMLLLPVAVCQTVTLAPQATLADGAAALLAALPSTSSTHSTTVSGVVRLEVPVPRTSTTALRWLSGQHAHNYTHTQSTAARAQSPAAAGPFLYFSGRRSSAPDTPGASAAEASTRGWSALAGAGAAWRWRGAPGGGFDASTVAALQRFLSADQPRVRILGGVRFDPRSQPDPEWEPFGSHCFVLPLLELTEAEDCCLLAVTVAWDPAAAAAAQEAGQEAGAGQGLGQEAVDGCCADLPAAVARAAAALRLMRPPAPDSSYGMRITRSEGQHTPSREEWDANMAALLGGLQEGHDTGAPAAAALASLLDPSLARQEYLTNGQQGLDDLLAALSTTSTASSPTVSTDATGGFLTASVEDLDAAAAGAGRAAARRDTTRAHPAGVGGDGLDALRDLLDGKAAAPAVSDWAARSGSATGPASGPGSTGGASAPAPSGVSCSAASEALSKVVMARRTTLRLEGELDPLHVLQSLQERDPRAYQLYFAPGAPGPSPASPPGPRAAKPAFLACTPERLYARTGRHVASEAVAGTRPRGRGGDIEQDFWLSLDLLRSAKDHAEFCTVRDWIVSQLQGLCEDVQVEIRKSVLKQGSVQHLFGRVAAVLKRGRNDAHVLAALHPTPAVCGRPREAALGYLDGLEAFDRGWYAGPFGWISGAGAEFVVAIRSGLVTPDMAGGPALAAEGPAAPAATAVLGAAAPVPAAAAPAAAPGPALAPSPPVQLAHLYAGVGVVRGSDPTAEWQELDLKIRPLSQALVAAPLASSAPNVNGAWAALLVEELCRLGVNMFCVAPGSRSSPLTHAIACHPRARLNVCIDERSLGFWALGYGRAAGRPAAVVTSSGTAVANLLPAVVEASLSGVPMLLLTADRPAELRDTAANQTIDQAKIFGGFTRWFFDVPPPAPDVPGRTILTTASTAYRYSVASAPPGPVHLNLQFREPLAPVAVPWQSGPFMQGLAHWQASRTPYTAHITGNALPAAPGWQPAPAPVLGPASGMAPPALASPHDGGDGGGPEVAALRSLLAGARRGLVVVGELIDPRDIVAAQQICTMLGWPVAADVLSGLRVGGAAGGAAAASTHAHPVHPPLPLVHHMDHLLLGDKGWWRRLRPDVVLQLGPHLTSKRIGQFMDWVALGEEGPGGAPPAPWVYVAPHTLRHDPSHLVSHRAVMGIAQFRDAVATQVAAAAGTDTCRGGVQAAPVSAYGRMLLELDSAVSHEVDAALGSLRVVSEPFIARSLATLLPPGHGLFVGNSMPIRDMDMYACGQRHAPTAPAANTHAGAHTHGSGSSTWGLPVGQQHREDGTGASGEEGGAAAQDGAWGPGAVAAAVVDESGSGGAWTLGVPVAANRGASGIDGVLSTAAGFAEGLSRPTTLLVGDLSFLHDINGLNLLRGGELRPPLTVVLVNNSGGGIFSFLPIAASVPEDEFTPLWATPQNVDLEAMCRAQGIPHQRVTQPDGLERALRAAWGLNRHSVVEVITDRTTNVELHRVVQAAALRAAKHAHRILNFTTQATAPAPAAASHAQAAASTPTSSPPLSPAAAAAAAGSPSSALPSPLQISHVSWRRYSLPLTQPLTSGPTSAAGDGPGHREGLLLSLELRGADGRVVGQGVGEVAPLPGLHTETLQEAEVQVAALSCLLRGVPVPPTLALLGGRLGAWLQGAVGLRDVAWLAPSVRFGLECAVLTALASAMGTTLAGLLAAEPGQATPQGTGSGLVHVNGLLSPPAGEGVSEEQAVAAAVAGAQQLVAAGYTAIKVKVARRPDPASDARLLAAVRRAVGPHVALRADANRGWPSLEAALAFGEAAVRHGVGLQYIEEPTADPRDMAEFYRRTGIPVAADESLDDGRLLSQAPTHEGPSSMSAPSSWAGLGSPHGSRTPGRGGVAAGAGAATGFGAGVGAGAGGQYSAHGLPADRAAGLAAVVVKPAAVGGLEAAAAVARWAQRRGVMAVVSSAFESSVGLAALLQLAAAVDAEAGAGASGATGAGACTHHGLGTLQWFAEDAVAVPLALQPELLPLGQGQGQGQGQVEHRHEQGGSPGGEFTPLQSVCGSVAQADQLLRACEAVQDFSGRRVGHEPLPEREVCLEVELGHDLQQADGWQHPAPSNGSSSHTSGMRVAVRGLEVLPPGESSTSPPSFSNGSSHSCRARPYVFLHGFLGSSADWLPLMRALAAAGHRCVALDLPGHGGTLPPLPHAHEHAHVPEHVANGQQQQQQQQEGAGGDGLGYTAAHTIPGAAACVEAAVRQLALAREEEGGGEGPVLVGYSLGARVALEAAKAYPRLWSGVVLVSGSPGIKDPVQAAARAANDDRLASELCTRGLSAFVRQWYEQPLWTSLRRHPAYSRMLARRCGEAAAAGAIAEQAALAAADTVAASGAGADAAGNGTSTEEQLAAALRGMSTGRMDPQWDALDPWVGPPVVLVVGERDAKFVDINTRVLARLTRSGRHGARPGHHGQQGQGQDGGHGVAGAAMRGSYSAAVAAAGAQLRRHGHAMLRVAGAGHAVHVECPEVLLGVLQEVAAAL